MSAVEMNAEPMERARKSATAVLQGLSISLEERQNVAQCFLMVDAGYEALRHTQAKQEARAVRTEHTLLETKCQQCNVYCKACALGEPHMNIEPRPEATHSSQEWNALGSHHVLWNGYANQTVWCGSAEADQLAQLAFERRILAEHASEFEGDSLVGAERFHGAQSHLNHLSAVLAGDKAFIEEVDVAYNSSWKQRGGVGAFFTLARKWDRLHDRVKRVGWDIFHAIATDKRREGTIDDVRDLRRYLALVECEVLDLGGITHEQGTKESDATTHRG